MNTPSGVGLGVRGWTPKAYRLAARLLGLRIRVLIPNPVVVVPSGAGDAERKALFLANKGTRSSRRMLVFNSIIVASSFLAGVAIVWPAVAIFGTAILSGLLLLLKGRVKEALIAVALSVGIPVGITLLTGVSAVVAILVPLGFVMAVLLHARMPPAIVEAAGKVRQARRT